MFKVSLFAVLSLTLFASQATAANRIECVGSHGDRAVLNRYVSSSHPERNTKGWFTITMDEALLSAYIGSVEDRVVEPEKAAHADVLSDWDGNSGVKISFGEGFLQAAVGAKSKAFVTVIYNDIATDRVSHPLSCVVTK